MSAWERENARLAAASDPATNALFEEIPPWDAYPEYAGPSSNGKHPVGGAMRAGEIRSQLLGPDDIDGLPDPTWLVDRYIPAGALVAIYGRPGSYKTFIAFDWACSVASGSWWLNNKVAAGPVLYVMAEGAGGLRRRKQAWEEGHHVLLRNMPLHVYPKAVNLLDPEWAEGVAVIAAELGVMLVVIDTVARCFPGGEENNSRDMGRLITAADLIRERCGGAVALVHHTPIEGNRLRGHSSLEGALDAAIGVECDGTTIKLTLAKQKDDESGFEMLLHPEKIKDSVVVRPGSAPADDKLPATVLATLRALADIDTEGGASASQWREASCPTKSTFYRHLKHLCGTGLSHAVSGAVGQPNARYRVTEQGKDLLYS